VLTIRDLDRCEQWFEASGLPYFVDPGHQAIERALAPRQVGLWAGLIAAPSALVGALTGTMSASATTGLAAALSLAGVLALARFVRVFRVALIGRWALRHAWSSRGLLGPLATRALPFLLLFITFLFINTEVWQVASSLTRGLLWSSVGVFVVLAIAFLAPSFGAEIERVGGEVAGDLLVKTCQGTPVASAARDILDEPALADQVAGVELTRLQRGNLMLMLFITQAVQVVALAGVVFAFFVVFGSIVIRPGVIESWVGHPPTYKSGGLHLISNELFSVAVFLSGFAGLYFTVQAVIDQNYRREFFSRVEHELRRAIGVRKVYVAVSAHLRSQPAGQ
jgi:hypothetical protein